MLVVQEIVSLEQCYISYSICNRNSHGIIRVAGIELLREKRKDLLKVILNIRVFSKYVMSRYLG